MDAGARDSLADVISKSLVKLATQPEGKVIFQLYFPVIILLIQEVALDDTLLAWPGTFEQWMRRLEYSSIDQLLEYSPDIQPVLELFEHFSYFLQKKLCNPPISMCRRLLCVHPFLRLSASKYRIQNSLVVLQTQICFNHPVITVSHSLPAIIHLHPQKQVYYFYTVGLNIQDK